ncbi:MAG: zinc ribbon domain-containing protein [Planctomycetaceae bacterium]|nr:zinc ribbon domain-containing protein [Planctomycetaceae bacterium]
MSKTYAYCQSCGMPLKSDPKSGGTEADGTISPKYCSYCYENGQFTGDFKSAKEMQTFCKQKLKEMGFNRFLAWFFTLNIPKLERWKK